MRESKHTKSDHTHYKAMLPSLAQINPGHSPWTQASNLVLLFEPQPLGCEEQVATCLVCANLQSHLQRNPITLSSSSNLQSDTLSSCSSTSFLARQSFTPKNPWRFTKNTHGVDLVIANSAVVELFDLLLKICSPLTQLWVEPPGFL